MKVTLDKVTKVFPSKIKHSMDVVAVDDFSFGFPDGKLIALLGPSGCGKSTTLNLISGLTKVTDGKIYFGEDDVTSLEAKQRGVGLVFQNYALYPHLTVKQNILFPLENLKGKDKLSKNEMNDRMIRFAKLVQVDTLLDRKPGELSGGQQQRVAIARALVKLPRVLLLDEPLSNLDARLRLQTREEIRRIQQATKITTLFVTHDQDEAMSISDFIVVMKEGKIQQTGKPQEVYDNPQNLFVAKFLGNPPINVFDADIKDGCLYIGNSCVMNNIPVCDKKVYAAIRPEGFIHDKDGALECDLQRVEVLGRDISVISKNKACQGEIRSLISSDVNIDMSAKVNFSIKPNKLFLFDTETQERIYLQEEGK